MADKKDPGKFTVRFNIHDPQHQTVVALLNQQGRNKAQFLASAVLHYINCKETPNLQVPPVDPETLEKIIEYVKEEDFLLNPSMYVENAYTKSQNGGAGYRLQRTRKN